MIVQKEGLPPYRYMIAELEADAARRHAQAEGTKLVEKVRGLEAQLKGESVQSVTTWAKERGMSEGVGRRNNALVAELVLDQFESISPYVIKQLLRDLMEENKELRAAISDTLDTWEKSTADEFYSWFGRAVKLARPVPHD